MASYPSISFGDYIPEPTGQVVNINAENVDEYAGIIGIPLAEFIKARNELPVVLPRQYVQLVQLTPRPKRRRKP